MVAFGKENVSDKLDMGQVLTQQLFSQQKSLLLKLYICFEAVPVKSLAELQLMNEVSAELTRINGWPEGWPSAMGRSESLQASYLKAASDQELLDELRSRCSHVHPFED